MNGRNGDRARRRSPSVERAALGSDEAAAERSNVKLVMPQEAQASAILNPAPGKVMAEWEKKDGKEKVVIRRAEHNGREFYDVRVWYRHQESGTWRPTKDGFTFPLDQWDYFVDAVKAADATGI